MRSLRGRLAVGLLALLVSGCTAGAGEPLSPSNAGFALPSGPLARPKVLNVAINEDPPNLWDVATQVGGAGGRQVLPMVNQFLAVVDADGSPQPRLLLELPSVELGTWTVAADGTMETTWKLRPDALWHDGAPLTVEDLAFSWRVNRDPEIPNANRAAADLISDVRATGPGMAMVRWARVYPFADRLSDRELVPVPRHLLERSYQEAKETLLLQPYWSTEYVGLGPYRVASWQRGVSLELSAFDRYFLGRARIDTIRLLFIFDANTTVANLYAQVVQTVLPPGELDFEAGLQVKADWEARGYGTVLVYPVRWTFIEPQKRRNPEPPDLADPRVRRALYHGLNRLELVRALFGDHGLPADSWVQPETPRYARVQDALTRYPHDPARAGELLREAGWQRGADGQLTKAPGRRFQLTLRGDERIVSILLDQWKGIGVSGQIETLPAQLQRDRAARASFTGADVNTGPTSLFNVVTRFGSDYIPGPENQWTGLNRGGYTSPQWDRLTEAFFVTLEEARRVEIERELVRAFTTDLPALPLYYGLEAVPTGGGLAGLLPIRGSPHAGVILHTWNVHEWDIRG